MKCMCKHILLACLLTVLEIYGTEEGVFIPYQFGKDKQIKRAISDFAGCYGGSFVELDITSGILNFSKKGSAKKHPVLFRVRRGDYDFCSVHYNPKVYDIYSANAAITVKRKTETPVVEVVLPMKEVIVETSGNQQTIPVDNIADERGRYMDLSAVAVDFTVFFKSGTFPSRNGCCGFFNRRWNFHPELTFHDLPFTCSHSDSVDLWTKTTKTRKTTKTTTFAVLAYVVEKRINEFTLVKGNTKKYMKGTFCRLGVKSEDFEVGFPKLGFKKHINVALKTSDPSEVVKGYRLFSKWLAVRAWHKVPSEDDNSVDSIGVHNSVAHTSIQMDDSMEDSMLNSKGSYHYPKPTVVHQGSQQLEHGDSLDTSLYETQVSQVLGKSTE